MLRAIDYHELGSRLVLAAGGMLAGIILGIAVATRVASHDFDAGYQQGIADASYHDDAYDRGDLACDCIPYVHGSDAQ